MRQYSIDQVEIGWLGVDFKEGIAQGSVITEARTTPSWTNKPTGNGRVVRVYNPDRSGTLSILVDQESKLHQRLRSLAIADRQTRNIVGAMTIKDFSNNETMVFTNAYIATEPDEVKATESSTLTWVFNYEQANKGPALDDANLVGN